MSCGGSILVDQKQLYAQILKLLPILSLNKVSNLILPPNSISSKNVVVPVSKIEFNLGS